MKLTKKNKKRIFYIVFACFIIGIFIGASIAANEG